jgi:murein DD-endopeptidase MepM/ murein hydrolase activator NlpD
LEVKAGGGIVLRPPFNGTYRLISYFDHTDPDYTHDNEVTIYTGESVADCSPYCYEGHPGIDWSMNTGTQVLAAADGVVQGLTQSSAPNSYGWRIVLEHENGYHTLYAHLSQFNVAVGQSVAAGDVIGQSGSTGTSEAHLHFGVYRGPITSADPNAGDWATDPFGWRGSDSDPLLDFGQGHTASCLWAGVPGDNISCADIIVEDDGTGWLESSGWTEYHRGNGYRQHWLNVSDPKDAEASWRPWYPGAGQIRYSGYYQIRAFIPADHSTTSSAHYKVYYDAYYTAHRYRNQGYYSNSWVSLGTYRLWAGSNTDFVSLYESGSGSGQMAADSMKFAASIVHLPDVRNSGGWTSSIVIRNNRGSSAQVAITYYNSSGSRVSDQTTTISANGSTTKTPPSGFSGSAVVVAS